ncbi:hypothetical protein BC940DRAFT_294664 [Gongronella butleri]|nr:hypothetical protein BC940DRAFT_294664 [Gongronella butleri]
MTMDGPVDTSYSLPHTNDILSPKDEMMVDEQAPNAAPAPNSTIEKPQLPSISNISPYSPIPHALQGSSATSSDEYIRHRLSDMSMTSAGRSLSHRGFSTSKASSPPPYDPIKPLEPMHYHDVSPTYSRRGSLNNVDRRPSITELTSLPLPSATTSRRESVATIVSDYDYQSSRSSSPSPYHAPPPPPIASSFHDAYQRRHSIATVEPSANRMKQQRPFRFPATIQESPHGIYSAPSSPPEMLPSSSHESDLPAPAAFHRTSRTNSHQGTYSTHRYAPTSSTNTNSAANASSSSSSRYHHPYAAPPSAATPPRRRSIFNEESPSLVRRASMPVVTTRTHLPSSSLSSRPLDYHGHPMDIDESPMAANGADPLYHHHHALGNAANAALKQRKVETPYSRSPELRISHKLAERKRRKEMKELFDELRDALPVEKNLKTSKWEILSKAVEFISMLKQRDYEKESEVNSLRHQLDMLKRERAMNNGPMPM